MRIPLSAPDITESEIDAVSAVLRSPRLSLGPKLEEFEQSLPITNTLQIFARTHKDARWSSPLRTKVTVQPTATAAKGN